MRRSYTAVSMPQDLCVTIENLIRENPDLGYTSISEFIKDASRRRIEELEQRKQRRIEESNGKQKQKRH